MSHNFFASGESCLQFVKIASEIKQGMPLQENVLNFGMQSLCLTSVSLQSVAKRGIKYACKTEIQI